MLKKEIHINNVPWIQSFDLGKTDVAGRLIF